MSTIRKKLASSPVKNSSKIIFREVLNFPLKISEDDLITCCFDLQIVTPFPAANPSAFTTTGYLLFFKKELTWIKLLQTLKLAVGIL